MIAPGRVGAFLKRCLRSIVIRFAMSPCTGAVKSTAVSVIGCVNARYAA